MAAIKCVQEADKTSCRPGNTHTHTWEVDIRVSDFFKMSFHGGDQEICWSPHQLTPSVDVVATGHVAARCGETGKTPSG